MGKNGQMLSNSMVIHKTTIFIIFIKVIVKNVTHCKTGTFLNNYNIIDAGSNPFLMYNELKTKTDEQLIELLRRSVTINF